MRRTELNPHRRYGAVAIAGIAALMLVVAGCSSANTSSTNGSASETIKIGAVLPVNTAAGDQSGAYAGIKAAVRAINAAGGVKGAKLELDFCNEEGNSNSAEACARKMVTDHVVATVFDSSTTAALQVSQILEAAKIAEVFPNAEFAGQFSLPNVFPIDGGPAFEFGGLVQVAKTMYHVNSMSIVRLDVPAVRLFSTVADNAAKNVGVKITSTVNIPLTVTDYAPYAAQVVNGKPGSVLTVITVSQSIPVVNAIQQAGGSTIRYLTGNSTFTPQVVAQLGPLVDGAIAASSLPDITDTSLPGIAQFAKDMDAEAAAGDAAAAATARSQNSLVAWLGVQAFAKVAESVSGTLDSQSFLTQLGKTNNLDLDGLITWSPGKTGPVEGYPRVTNFKIWLSIVRDGKYTGVGNTPIDTSQALEGLKTS
jgi:ABC-type branched-subunit amino acid transport system substrate-binding protein